MSDNCQYELEGQQSTLHRLMGTHHGRRACQSSEGAWGSMSSSLSRFSGWTLSLGGGLTDSIGAWDGTRADGVLDRGRRRLFFLALLPGGAVELPGRSRSAPGGVDRHHAQRDRAELQSKS